MQPWAQVPFRLKVYILSVVIVAAPILLQAIRLVLFAHYGYQWVVLTALTLITAPIFVFYPNAGSLVTIGDAFVISICMLYGTPPGILSNTLHLMLLTLLWRRKSHSPIHRVIFNIATAVINAALYGTVYHLLNPENSFSLENILNSLTHGGKLVFHQK